MLLSVCCVLGHVCMQGSRAAFNTVTRARSIGCVFLFNVVLRESRLAVGLPPVALAHAQ